MKMARTSNGGTPKGSLGGGGPPSRRNLLGHCRITHIGMHIRNRLNMKIVPKRSLGGGSFYSVVCLKSSHRLALARGVHGSIGAKANSTGNASADIVLSAVMP